MTSRCRSRRTLSTAAFAKDAAGTGVRVKRVVFAGGQRIVLFSWGASSDPRLRNVSAVDRDGSTRWVADLPLDTNHDCFVKLEASGHLLLATTFSGHVIRLCPATGRHLT